MACIWRKTAFLVVHPREMGKKGDGLTCIFTSLTDNLRQQCLIFGLENNFKFCTLKFQYSFCFPQPCVPQPFVHFYLSSGLRLPGFAALCLINSNLVPSSIESLLSSLGACSRDHLASSTYVPSASQLASSVHLTAGPGIWMVSSPMPVFPISSSSILLAQGPNGLLLPKPRWGNYIRKSRRLQVAVPIVASISTSIKCQ